jgi:inosine-uridine nucleoside N-ribohydrolase
VSVANRNDIPVYKGAYNASWLGVRTPAVKFLINHVMEHPDEITLITLAPLTNVASAILLEPKFIENLKALLMMGGVFFPSNTKFPYLQAEFNFSRDPKATQIVISQDIENTIVGLDLTTRVLFKDAHFNALQAGNTQITNYLTRKIKSWLFLNKLLMGGFNPHDPLCIAYLLDRSMYKVIKASVEVEVLKERRKPEFIDKKYSNSLIPLLISSLGKNGRLRVTAPPSDSRRNKIHVCTKIDERRFLELLIQRLSKR